ncbi:MAG: class I SAM-dependent methyltransferase [Cyanobacteria bacterium J06641_5]
MNPYARLLFPRLLDWSMSGEITARYRRQVLKDLSGDVLEIGCGTGLNFPYYPSSLQTLVASDPNPGMLAIARKRQQELPFAIELVEAGGEALPFASDRFDAVVSTWTLCSIPDSAAALAEFQRVLKPGGKFVFVEHGLSPEQSVQTWQNRLTPIQKRIADGCHLNRNIAQLVESAGFAIASLEHLYMPDIPKVLGYLYLGAALKPTSAA